MSRWHARRDRSLKSKWRVPMLVNEAESNRFLVVADLINHDLQAVHSERMIPHPINKSATHISEKL